MDRVRRENHGQKRFGASEDFYEHAVSRYDGYIEDDDTEEKARSVRLARKEARA